MAKVMSGTSTARFSVGVAPDDLIKLGWNLPVHLAKIDIYGFKSFGQEVHIELPPGVTGLVGPNGGGKSNVVDAIRWALGEQKVRELRAERWDDLLFAGNAQRTAARLAEVCLHFDNGDGAMGNWPETLTVTRRLYRHGESEYLINGRSVRLRDVLDLFLDSGIGRFNYAIISQGRVESALMQKPKERLEQLEEAAGVSRYKVRKVETLSHLADVENNLERLADLQQETGRQMEEVRTAAERERQYLQWQTERTEWQGRLNVTEYQRDQVRLSAMKVQEQEWDASLSAMVAEMSNLESQIETLKTKEQEWAGILEAEDARVATSQQQALQLDQELSELRLRLEAQTREAERLQGERAELEQQQGLLVEEFQEVEQMATLQEKTLLEATYRELRNHVDRAQGRVTELKTKSARLEERLGAALRRRGELERQLSRWQGALGVNSIEDLARARQERQQAMGRLEGEVAVLEHRLDEMVQERAQLRQKMSQAEQHLAPLRQRRSQNEARLRALRQLEADGEGLPSGVRAVMKGHHEKRLQGIYGTLGALVQSDPGLALALQVSLGGSANDIIVTDEAHARTAVKYLQANQLGRATFLPLNTIRPTNVPDGDKAFAQKDGVVGWAIDLVRYDQTIWAAVSHILGRVLVIETLDQAMHLGPQHRFRYKMVTLDGQLVHAGGAITGGHHSQRDPRYGRRVEIESLVQRLAEETTEVSAREHELVAIQNDLTRLEPDLDGIREQLSERRQALSAAQQRGNQQPDLEDPVALEHEFSTLKEAIRRDESERDQVKARWAQETGELEHLQDKLREHHERLQDVNAKHRHQQILTERMEQERHRIEARHRRLLQLLADLANTIEGHAQAIEKLQTQRSHRALEVEERHREQRGARTRWDAMKQEGLAAENRLRAVQHEERRLASKLAQSQQAIFRIEHRWEDAIPLPEFSPLSADEESRAHDEIRRLRDLMGDLDQIVPGSLMLFEQLNERYAYFEDQMQDIQGARLDLRKTLEELDEEVNRRVEVTVSRVEQSFAEACRILYAGGEGGISFVEQGDRGVELWVKPPGKRPAHLSLLSGGEKALGGIAWLFALLAVKPSPFVILDEVEASLDEANALRFAEYLGEFRRSAQCVIVTHHKETMAVADALWGVAGDGQGQSRLISVLLDEVLVP